MIPHLNHLVKTVQIRGQYICFYAKLTKIILNYHQILPLILELCHFMTEENIFFYHGKKLSYLADECLSCKQWSKGDNLSPSNIAIAIPVITHKNKDKALFKQVQHGLSTMAHTLPPYQSHLLKMPLIRGHCHRMR